MYVTLPADTAAVHDCAGCVHDGVGAAAPGSSAKSSLEGQVRAQHVTAQHSMLYTRTA